MYIHTGSSMQINPSKSRDLADENNKILTEWKRFEITVLHFNVCLNLKCCVNAPITTFVDDQVSCDVILTLTSTVFFGRSLFNILSTVFFLK